MEAASALTFCRWVIGITFAVSAIGKATSMVSFRAAVAEFGVLPARLTDPVAAGTVAAEGLVVVLVALGGGWATAGFVLAMALLAVFSAALVLALRRKAGVSCNCFGSSERRISWYDVLRNAALVACCIAGLWGAHSWAGGRPGVGLVLVLGLMAATFMVIVSNLEDIVELLRRPYVVD
jgi:Methylamine utilisation protein MauE